MTIRHYHDFGGDRALVGDDLRQPSAWDAVRTRSRGPFALPASRAEWEQLGDANQTIMQRAAEVDRWLRNRATSRVASYGVGHALLERRLHQLDPARSLELGEYAPNTVERLHRVFPEARVHHHDLLIDPPLAADVHLFHRIDTEFTNEEWREVLQAFARETILVVATELLGLGGAMREFRNRFLKRNATRAGLVRNRTAFEALWRGTHRATATRFADLEGWVLEPRTSPPCPPLPRALV